ncbi:MAG TPA: PLP-dependent aminotransferase family protein [Verrucomicrobiae bacterium]
MIDWNEQFAAATQNMRRNTVREFLKYAGRAGMISFGGGLPAAELFPMDEFQNASEAVLRKYGSRALQYGETEGVPELRENVAQRHGVGIENVLITSGAQQALDLLGRVLIDRGDVVAVENPTYLALLSSWRVHEPEFTAVEPEDIGGDKGALKRAELFYLVPNFQNPKGTTLTLETREKVAEFASTEEMAVIEDDPYGALRYEREALPSIFELAGKCGGPVVSVGTFSKILAPGLRVGWVIANKALIEKLVQAKQSADLHTSTLNQYLACELAMSGLLTTHVPKLCLEYGRRRAAMLAALEEFMPGEVTWSRPAGGMFLLVRMPEVISGAEVAREALEENVLVVPGDDFHIVGGRNTLRLNFSNCAPDSIRRGIQTLGKIVGRFLNEESKYRVSFSSV